MRLDDIFLQQLKALTNEHDVLRRRSGYNNMSDIDGPDVTQFITRAQAAIHRLAGPTSPYAKQSEAITNTYSHHCEGLVVRDLHRDWFPIGRRRSQITKRG
ncbi:hypothetical protein LCGC14_2601670, partial [marine sediment metagenome]